MLMPRVDLVHAQSNSIVMGYSGAGISTDLRRIIEEIKKSGFIDKLYDRPTKN
jgi:deoxyhypusine synthase